MDMKVIGLFLRPLVGLSGISKIRVIMSVDLNI